MKYLFATVIIMMAGLYAKAQTSSPAGQPVTSGSFSIVYVNSDSLINNYEYYKSVRIRLQALTTKAQSDLATKSDAFQKEVAAYQKSVNSLTPAQRAVTEKRLAKKQQDLQVLGQSTGKQLQDEEAAQNEKLYNKLAAYLKVYAKSKGYKMVLTYSKANTSMLYGDESLDVTKEVISGLNDDYRKNPN